MKTTKDLLVPCDPATSPPYAHFFGYYDKCPWDSTGRYILSHRAEFDGRPVTHSDDVEIGLIDLENNKEFMPIDRSHAWNWQQGAMTQWVPNAPDRLVIFNSRENDRAVSVLYDIDSQERHTLPMPIYTLTPDGHYALTIDFDWLGQARGGYGYATEQSNISIDPNKNGIFRMDLSTGDCQMILSYNDVINFEHHPIMKRGVHWIETLSSAPGTANRFAFRHRFSLPNGGMYTRVMTANLQGEALHSMISGSASHAVWMDASHFLVWARHRTLSNQFLLRSLIKRLRFNWVLEWLHTQRSGWVRQNIIGDTMLLITDRDDEIQSFGAKNIIEDGHPSLSPTGPWLVMDTYPDDDQYRHLFLFNYEENRRIDLGAFYSPPQLNYGWRCDLHPRWNRDGTVICIDSGHAGTRQMYLLDVSSLVKT